MKLFAFYCLFAFYYLLSFLFYFQSAYASMARLEEKKLEDNDFLKKDRTSEIFFKNAICVNDPYQIPSSDSSKKHIVPACYLDFSNIKDKSEMLLKYISNSKNWNYKIIHPLLYKTYYKYGNRRKFAIQENQIIVYVSNKDRIFYELLERAQENCSLLSLADIQKDQIPLGKFFNKACSIRIFKKDLYKKNQQSLYEILSGSDFKKDFIESLNKEQKVKSPSFSPFDVNKTIYYIPGFNMQVNENQSLNRFKDPGSQYFDLHIAEFSIKAKNSFYPIILNSIVNPCENLPKNQVDKSKIPSNRFYLQGCFLKIKKNSASILGLESFYNEKNMNQLFNQIDFKALFLEQVSLKFEIQDISEVFLYSSDFDKDFFQINIVQTQDIQSLIKSYILNASYENCIDLEFSQIDRNKVPQDYVFRQACKFQITYDPIEFKDIFNPKINNEIFQQDEFKAQFLEQVRLNFEIQNTSKVVVYSSHFKKDSFQINIMKTEAFLSVMGNEILLQSQSLCESMNAYYFDNTDFKEKLFKRGCSIHVVDSPFQKNEPLESYLDIERFNQVFNESFKNEVLKNINRNLNEIQYPEDSLVYVSNLKNGSFKINIIELQTIKELVQKELLENSLIKKCLKIFSTDLEGLKDYKLPQGHTFVQGCELIFISDDIGKNKDLLKKLNTEGVNDMFSEQDFKEQFISNINFKNTYTFKKVSSNILNTYFNYYDGFFVMKVIETIDPKEVLKNIIASNIKNCIMINEEDINVLSRTHKKDLKKRKLKISAGCRAWFNVPELGPGKPLNSVSKKSIIFDLIRNMEREIYSSLESLKKDFKDGEKKFEFDQYGYTDLSLTVFELQKDPCVSAATVLEFLCDI